MNWFIQAAPAAETVETSQVLPIASRIFPCTQAVRARTSGAEEVSALPERSLPYLAETVCCPSPAASHTGNIARSRGRWLSRVTPLSVTTTMSSIRAPQWPRK